MQVKKQQLELDMGQQTGSTLAKEYIKAVYCHTAYLTYAEYIMKNAWLDEAQAWIKIVSRNINNSLENVNVQRFSEAEILRMSRILVWLSSMLKIIFKKFPHFSPHTKKLSFEF